jgi:hypothetical protein
MATGICLYDSVPLESQNYCVQSLAAKTQILVQPALHPLCKARKPAT